MHISSHSHSRLLPSGLLVVALLLPLLSLAPSSPGAPWADVGPNVNVSRLRGNQTEATIAINPTNPANIVALSNIESGAGLFKAYSVDGGTTWTADRIADGDNLGRACCDPSAAFDEFGNLFLTYLDSTATDIQLAMSTDGGATFTFVTTIKRASSTARLDLSGIRSGGPVDQPTVATGPGSVWVTYETGGHIEARGGAVTGLGLVGPFNPPQAAPSSSGGNFGDIVVGPEGQAMVTYQNNTAGQGPALIFVNLDPDGLGPAGFGGRVTVTNTNVGGFDYMPAQDSRSVDAEAGLAYDRSSGPYHGRVYLVYTDETPNESHNMDILVRASDDDGATWSGPVQVNDDAGRTTQFLPRMAVDQTTGHVVAAWHDARSDRGDGGPGDTNGIPNDDAQLWAAVSFDGGASFDLNTQVSAGTSNDDAANNGIDYGDYIGLAASAGAFYPAWADNSNSTGDNPDGSLSKFDIYTARVSIRPSGATRTPTLTRTSTRTRVPSRTPTVTNTRRPTRTPTVTRTRRPTRTPTATRTPRPTRTWTATATP